jgi:hypothetical protein
MADDNEERLGGRVGRILGERGLSQDWLVRHVDGLSQQNLSNLISRNSKTSEFALRIADALNVSARWLLDGVGQPTGSTSEPSLNRYTSETPTRVAVISANLTHPEAALLLRMVEASKLPGVTVEVKTWTEPNQADQAEEMETEDQQAGRHRHVGQSGVVVKATSRRSKKGAA